MDRPVKHDAPYYDFPEGSECLQDLIEDRDMSWNQANIMKAALRWGVKGGASDLKYDLEKILWFAERELRRLQANGGAEPDAAEGMAALAKGSSPLMGVRGLQMSETEAPK